MLFSDTNELPRRKQRGILKSIERPKGLGYLSAVFMAGLSAFYQPFTSLWLVGWLAGWRID